MTRLILMRHAKAEPGGAGPDFDRALAPRGRQDAARLGDWLRAEGYRPDRALVSSARRTLETWEGLRLEAPMEARRDLYEASAEAILAAASGLAGTVLVVGHNPGIGGAAMRLAPGVGDRYPTGATAVIDVDSETGRLVAFVTPKGLRAAPQA